MLCPRAPTGTSNVISLHRGTARASSAQKAVRNHDIFGAEAELPAPSRCETRAADRALALPNRQSAGAWAPRGSSRISRTRGCMTLLCTARIPIRAEQPPVPLRRCLKLPVRQLWFLASRLRLVEVHAAVNLDGLPGHVGVADHHEDDLRYLLRQAEATQRDLAGRRRSCRNHVCLDQRGCHRID